MDFENAQFERILLFGTKKSFLKIFTVTFVYLIALYCTVRDYSRKIICVAIAYTREQVDNAARVHRMM